MSLKTETIRIEGMSCMHCVGAVKTALQETQGITNVDEVKMGEARVTYDDAQIDRASIDAAIEEAGYTPVTA